MKALAMAAALAVACTPYPAPEPPPREPLRVALWVDPAFAPEDAAEVRAAARQWAYALNGYLDFVEPFEAHDHTVNVNLALEEDVPPAWHDYLGWDERIGGREISLIPSRIHAHGHRVEVTALHEIGHYLGVDHDTWTGTLMSTPLRAEVPCIDSRTLHRIAAVQGWLGDRLIPTCQ